nr:MAG TPA: hypothetical protein [Caudoviricetes sp.]
MFFIAFKPFVIFISYLKYSRVRERSQPLFLLFLNKERNFISYLEYSRVKERSQHPLSPF